METYLSMEIKAKENQMEVQYKCLSEVDFCCNHQKVVNSRLQNLPGTHFSQMSATGLHSEVAGINFMDYDIQ